MAFSLESATIITMSFYDIKDWVFSLFEKLSKKELLEVVVVFKNKIEDQEQEIKKNKEEVQKLKDEINKLKGENGKPNIKPNKPGDDQGNNDRPKPPPKPKSKRGKKARNKKEFLKTQNEIQLEIDKSKLPPDAKYQGTRSIIIQDIEFKLNNTKLIIPIYYSKELGKNFEPEIPFEFRGSEFGPVSWAFIKQMHFEGRLTQKVLWKILLGVGLDISQGQVSNMILGNKNITFDQEMKEARAAGIVMQNFGHIDDTGARIEARNGVTTALVNDFFCQYVTSASKNRLNAIKVLAGGTLKYCLNEVALNYIDAKIGNRKIFKKLRELKNNRVYTDDDFAKHFLTLDFLKDASLTWIKHIQEGCAIAALRAGMMGPVANILICDDAPQFKGILELLGLCWVHELRPYKKLMPTHSDFEQIQKDFLDKTWKFYDQLKAYKEQPIEAEKLRLDEEFDILFSTPTKYYALNGLMKKTFDQKKFLMLVLEYPDIPLHNNPAELVMREKVIQKKIRMCHRKWIGAICSDLYLSLMATCRKNKISFGEYLRDRFLGTGNILPLSTIINSSNTLTY